ncbi:MAG: ribonucleoside-diphosphate reductase beta chain [Solirubrobacterales bacterium]|jgi:1,2-phenylacetyl-CoA epoxidase catalytic subunit|nr:ribonucleoside-diphosphate reductase beta chain [Solirubrobacterales bacterium]
MSVAQKDGIKAAEGISYDDLYRRWEQSSWQATAIDFSQDRVGWAALSDVQRRSALWIYSMFFYGEDSVTDNLSPYIDAAPREEQKYFLATQQVDEARHAVFFHRFFKDVIGAGDSIASTLAYTQSELSWGYRGVFDRLDRMADDLRRDRSLPNFARAIALYHMVVEASMAQPGQHFIEDFFADAGTMPGFSEGMANVSRDEQRHIGFGVKVLSECFAESEECKEAVAELLREVLPYTPAVFWPIDKAREYTRAYGFELEELFAFGLRSVRTKWRATGYPMEEMPGVLPVDPDLPPEEVARRQIILLEAGVMGPPNGRPDSSPEVQQLHFDLIARAARTDVVNGDPMTIQWRFSDADPWYLRIDNGSTAAQPGLAESADLTIEANWQDWVETATKGADARKLLLRRRLRPRGSLRNLLRAQRVFPPRPNRLG